MSRQLLPNEHISFVVTKPFTSRGKEYSVGEDFPQEEARDIDTFVRARFVAPVVDDLAYKPRHWHREVQLKETLLAKLNRDNVQLMMPYEPDSDEVVNLDVLTHPETTPEPTQEGTTSESGVDEGDTNSNVPGEEYSSAAPAESAHSGQYDPSFHTVREVVDHLATVQDQEERDRIIESERENRGRKGIVNLLEE